MKTNIEEFVEHFSILFELFETKGCLSEEDIESVCIGKYLLGLYPKTKEKLICTNYFINYLFSKNGHIIDGSIKIDDIKEIWNLPNYEIRMSDKYHRGGSYDLFFTKSLNRKGYYEWIAKENNGVRELYHYVYKSATATRYIKNNKDLIIDF